ncbi:MAG: type I 3-dehydroquinate dehydratase [Jeotgalicoccus sp.]
MNTTKIVVTLSGHNDDEIKAEINKAKDSIDDFDIVEIRGDVFDALNREDHGKKVQFIIDSFKPLNKEIIYTYRTAREGGSGSKTTVEYEALLKAVCKSMDIDYIDIEVQSGDKITASVVETARENNVKCLMSHHDFKHTPNTEEILSVINKMEKLGGDIYKVAYFPKDKRDVENMTEAVKTAKTEYGDKVVGISMGELGKSTRTAQGEAASVFTYGFVARDAAPGQIHVTELRSIFTK